MGAEEAADIIVAAKKRLRRIEADLRRSGAGSNHRCRREPQVEAAVRKIADPRNEPEDLKDPADCSRGPQDLRIVYDDGRTDHRRLHPQNLCPLEDADSGRNKCKGGVDSDPQRQRQNRQRGELGAAAEIAEPVTDILQQ